MASKKPTAKSIKNVLDIPHFKTNREVVDQDPIESTSMKLNIDRIDPFDRNPRRAPNPEYEALLESLRAKGQEEALTITRRPGSSKFMIKRGGNTRLEIMKMLYSDAGDIRFETIDCLFKPWISESDCIVGHLTENTTQGLMTLIDKARGYREFKLEYEKENGIQLGQRKLVELLKQMGAPINPSLLGLMYYALDVLESAIPEVMTSGLGRPQVERLRRLDNIFQRMADAHNLFDAPTRQAQIHSEFHQLLSDHDGEDWDIEVVVDDFAHRLAGWTECPLDRIRYDIQACMKVDPFKMELISVIKESFYSTSIDDESSLNTQSLSETTTAPPTSHANTGQPPLTTAAPASKKAPQKSTIAPLTEGGLSRPLQQETTVPVETPQTLGNMDGASGSPIGMSADATINLKEARQRIYQLALEFAKSTNTQKYIIKWNYGYGFFLDAPQTPLVDMINWKETTHEIGNRYLEDVTLGQKVFGWWMLWHMQGIIDHRTIIPGFHVMPESLMKKIFEQIYNPENGQIGSIGMTSGFASLKFQTGGPGYLHEMALAYSYLDPTRVLKYVDLLREKTLLQAYIEENSINIWEVQQ